MFFKISLGSIVILVIAVCVYMSTSTSPVPLISKNEAVVGQNQIPKLAESHQQINLECRSFITTTKGKICVEQGVIVENSTGENETVASTTEISEDFSIPKYFNFPEDGSVIIQNSNTETISTTTINNPKVTPGTIFIPFFFKSCFWFCK